MPVSDRDVCLQGLQKLGLNPTEAQLKQIDDYVLLLKKWQTRMNLISPNTINHIYERHILDSAQLVPHVSRGTILDMGAGAGLPSVVLAIFDVGVVHACERINKKAMFIQEVSRQLGLLDRLIVHNCPVEDIAPIKFTTITARAVTELSDLFSMAHGHVSDDTILVFPKGKNVQEEILQAEKKWVMTLNLKSSITSLQSEIVVVSNLKPKQ